MSRQRKRTLENFSRDQIPLWGIFCFIYPRKTSWFWLTSIVLNAACLQFLGEEIIPLPFPDIVKNVILYLIRVFQKTVSILISGCFSIRDSQTNKSSYFLGSPQLFSWRKRIDQIDQIIIHCFNKFILLWFHSIFEQTESVFLSRRNLFRLFNPASVHKNHVPLSFSSLFTVFNLTRFFNCVLMKFLGEQIWPKIAKNVKLSILKESYR